MRVEAELRPRGPYSLRLSGRLASDPTRVVRGGVYDATIAVDGELERVVAVQRPDGTHRGPLRERRRSRARAIRARARGRPLGAPATVCPRSADRRSNPPPARPAARADCNRGALAPARGFGSAHPGAPCPPDRGERDQSDLAREGPPVRRSRRRRSSGDGRRPIWRSWDWGPGVHRRSSGSAARSTWSRSSTSRRSRSRAGSNGSPGSARGRSASSACRASVATNAGWRATSDS